MSKQILVDIEGRILIKEDGIIKYFYYHDKYYNVGDLFIGKIIQKHDDLCAFFVDFGDSKNGFLPYKNIFSQNNIKIGDYILVQIKKELRDTKGAYLTNIISFASQYFVYIPYSKTNGVFGSKKLCNSEVENMKLHIKDITDLLQGTIIIRTESHEIDIAILRADLKNLYARWIMIAEYRRDKISKIKNMDRTFTIIYNHLENNTFICVQTSSLKEKLSQYIVSHKIYVNELIDIEYELNEIIQSRIILPSNAMISIDQTEAIIAIDVNSFKARNTSISQINLEAAEEIIKQIFIKNLSGLIVIDFISDTHQESLAQFIKQQLKTDKLNADIEFISKMSICIISRERIGKNIWEVMGKTCSMCQGYGIIPNDKTYFNFHKNSSEYLHIAYHRMKYYFSNKLNFEHTVCKYDKYNIFTHPFNRTIKFKKFITPTIKIKQ